MEGRSTAQRVRELGGRFGIAPVQSTLELRVKNRLLGPLRLSRLFRIERGVRVRLDWRRRLRAWRLGFSSSNYLLYDLDRNDPALYLADADTLVDAINNPHLPSIGNKLGFSRMMELLGMPHPEVYALLHRGRAHLFEGASGVGTSPRRVLEHLLGKRGRVVLKPTHDFGGHGILFLDATGDGLRANGIATDLGELAPLLPTLEHYYVSEYALQAAYARALCPDTPNSLRILTLWDFDRDEPFVAVACHRIGTSRSFPVDNFHQGLGGLSAPIDVATGVLGAGITMDPDGTLYRHVRHPETGATVEGCQVPHWREGCEKLLRTAAGLPQIPYVGWDLIAREEGFCCLEANCPPSFPVWQVHEPLLADPRTRRSLEMLGLTARRSRSGT